MVIDSTFNRIHLIFTGVIKLFGAETKMKYYFVILQIILGVITFPTEIVPQIDMQNYIGKSRAELIVSLGKPVYTDDSNKSMVMMFYKSGSSNKSFVSNEKGIFQAEAVQSYESEKTGRAALNGYISDMISKGFSVDTVSATEFHSEKPGVTCTFRYSQNSISGKYEISVSAHRRE